MVFLYSWLKEYTKNIPKPEKLAEFLNLKIFEVEELKQINDDYLIDINVLPNRTSDCLSYWGMAREISGISGARFNKPKFSVKEDKKTKAKDFISLSVEDKTDCLRYTGRIITGVKVGPSSDFIKNRLAGSGLNSINNIVDIANYVMLETGQPIHIFDYDKIESAAPKVTALNPRQTQKTQAKGIIIRRARGGERIITFDNKSIDLDKDVLLISDIKGPLAIAGIKGGKRAEIDNNTKTIVIESANFNGQVARKASKKINLKTDASWRFENKIDPNLTEEAINRAAFLIRETAGGNIASGMVDFYPKKYTAKKIKIKDSRINGILGASISKKEIKNILEKLGLRILNITSSGFTAEAPAFRLDLNMPEDIIEEIGRIYGYEKIPAIFPIASLIPPKRNFWVFWKDEIKNILSGLGFYESYNYSYIGDKEAQIFNYKKEEIIEIVNPVSAEQKYLRPSMLPNLIKNAGNNLKYFDKVKIFELGNIFLRPKNEKLMLTGVIAKGASSDLFYEAKGIIDSLLSRLGVPEFFYDEFQATPEESHINIWEIGRRAEIKVGVEEIGFLGEISSKILDQMKIKAKVVGFDIDFEKLVKLSSEEHEYRPISQHPAAIRDLAVLVPYDVKVDDVLNIIENTGGMLVRDVDLFDIYEGEKLPDGKKNLAFRIIYQAEDRTLKSKEIEELQNKITNALEQNLEWEVRK